MSEQTFFIGEAAKRAGTTIKTIRYYERIGLTPKALRQGKFRIYTDKTVQRIRFIKTSQTLGFSLQEIREILSAYDLGNHPCQGVGHIIDEKLPLIEEKICELQSLQQVLISLKQVLPSSSQESDQICPAISAIVHT